VIPGDGHSCGMSISRESHNWFSLFCSHGSGFGYYPEPIKSFVVVNEQWMSKAAAIFGDLGVRVVTGHRF